MVPRDVRVARIEYPTGVPSATTLRVVLLVFLLLPPAARLADAQPRAMPIADIQGPGARSPVEGQLVMTTGIVTGRKTNGFFIQSPDSATDADPRTSDGLFVFTSAAPAAALTPGTLVAVTGRVLEFVPSADPRSPPLTEIEGPTVEIRGAGGTLPAPVEITPLMLHPRSAHDDLERFESMRVRVAALTLVSPTLGSVNEANATGSSNGVFYGVLPGVPRPMREPGIDVRDLLPDGAPCCVPRFDGNPERLRVDSDGQPGAPALNLPAGTVVTNLVGPLDYGFRSYTVLPDPSTPPVVGPMPDLAAATPSPTDHDYSIATLNAQRFFDTADDPTVGDAVLTAAAFQVRLTKLSLYIRRLLHTPDFVALQEVENLATLQAIAAVLNRDARESGAADPGYTAYLEEGNDPSGIDVGVLVKTARVEVLDFSQAGRASTFLSPAGRLELLHDRPPFVLVARVSGPFNARPLVTLVVNHLRSLNDIASATDGARVRAKRAEQAEYVADLVQRRLADDPHERLIVLGDLNAFEVNDGYVDVVGTVSGAPAPRDQTVRATRDRLEPDLVNLVETRPPADRYSYVFDGTAQTLDHVLVTSALVPYVTAFRYVRGNADAPEAWRSDARRPERVSDHDAALLYLSFFPPATGPDRR
ncbi:MAG: endonuclease/exonuclease/phosphatase family protein [Acidobacteriota bacterium]